MSQLQLVEIQDDGVCVSVNGRCTTRGIPSIGRRALHLQYCSHGIALYSVVEPRALQSPTTAHFSFQLPPPLNAHVYPTPLYAVAVDEEERVSSLSLDHFKALCDELGELALKPEMCETVYDVPAIPLTYDERDDAAEEQSDDEHDDGDVSDNESCIESLDDDDEWVDIDDDDTVAT